MDILEIKIDPQVKKNSELWSTTFTRNSLCELVYFKQYFVIKQKNFYLIFYQIETFLFTCTVGKLWWHDPASRRHESITDSGAKTNAAINKNLCSSLDLCFKILWWGGVNGQSKRGNYCCIKNGQQVLKTGHKLNIFASTCPPDYPWLFFNALMVLLSNSSRNGNGNDTQRELCSEICLYACSHSIEV